MVPYKPFHHHPEVIIMGSRPTSPPPQDTTSAPPAYAGPSTSFKTSFDSLSLHKTDRIRLLQFPAPDIAAVRDAIRANWPPGLQDERAYAHAHELKCHGNPWQGQYSDAISARILMRGILARLHARGWILTAATDVSKSVLSKDTLLFRQQLVPPPASSWLAISFNQGDRLRLMGAPAALRDAFDALLRDMGLCQDARWKAAAQDAFEFKLRGWPWRAQAEETMTTRLLLLRMLEALEAHGWSLYAAVEQNNGTMGHATEGGYGTSSTGADSWYCVKADDWLPGMSVFHR